MYKYLVENSNENSRLKKQRPNYIRLQNIYCVHITRVIIFYDKLKTYAHRCKPQRLYRGETRRCATAIVRA